MTFNINVAEKIAERALAELRELPFAQLEPLLDENKKTVVVGSDGVRYNVVTYALPDLGDAVRVVAAVDDGGGSAFKPLVRDFIVAP
ncbi:hypothetical protein [Micromonospora sp. NPDC023888]|uniref:hypothetical protein n=1 Tax=Micromonospora sp. NPDC023888 TaxID=3155607 RepID=UPI0033F3DA52